MLNYLGVLRSKLRIFVQVILVAFIFGFCLSIIFTLIEAVAKEYIHYKLYYLFILLFQENFSFWIINIIGLFFLASVVYLIISKILYLLVKDREQARLLLAFVYCFALFIIAYFLIPIFMPGELVIYFVYVDIGLIIIFIGLGYLIAKKGISDLLKSKMFQHVYKLAIFLICFVFLFNAAVLAYRKLNQPQGPNIIIIAADALRPDHLSTYGYHRPTTPTIDKLANQGTVFFNAYSNSTWTKPSVASLFSSFNPTNHGLEIDETIMPYSMLTMAEVFKDQGYRTYYVNAGNLFINNGANYDQGFDYFKFLDIPDLGVSIRADVVFDDALEQILKHRKDKFFAYIHLMDTHVQYNKNRFNKLFTNKEIRGFEPGNIKSQVIRQMTTKNLITKEFKEYLIDIYDGQIRFTDECLKNFLAKLDRLELLENTVVIFTADHGEEFWEHGNFGHGHAIYEEVIRIPLIIWGKDVKKLKINTPIRIIDIFPTALGLAGIKAKVNDFEGVDIFEDIQFNNNRKLPIFAYDGYYATLIKDGMKLIVNINDKQDSKGNVRTYAYVPHELFDLEADPLEKNNLLNEKPEIVSKMKKEIDDYMISTKGFDALEHRAISGDRLKQLRALGYIQ